MSIKLSPIEYLLILQMRNDSSLTLSTAEEDYIKGLRLAGKTSETLLKPKREKWHTYLNYINKVKKDAIESGQDATKATGAYNSAKKLKLGEIDLATYQAEITALDLSPTNPDKLHYMTSQLASEYQKYIASDDVTLTLNGETLPDLE
tara:strand:- start:3304 stop:3747 length:444 start_codon:yes stop_codon:yes gene_type:complete